MRSRSVCKAQSRITSLPLPVLENLSVGVACALRIALLDFTNLSDLENWLAQNVQ
ncbi:DUF4351 domain-containing protein [Gloeocapsa sp. PCC 7428]|uniref:DUF4351 domain-containing protein n=1 Tax=Gloeocapsa sp. PCC 7428 TaxID=1173026 RepID=UPI0002E6CB08|nr:DUF4351 domain-containing protein [Gloeocapsa sp. PCC 7428]